MPSNPTTNHLGEDGQVNHPPWLRSSHDTDAEDLTYDFEQATRWISGVGPDLEHYEELLSIEHLGYVAQVRSLMPVPAYRDEEEMLFGYLGYPEPPTKEHEAGAA